MPVVNEDWVNPSVWAGVSVSWGVVCDGGGLRLARMTSGGRVESFQVSVADWRAGDALRTRLTAEVTKGARVVAGLPPSQVLLRSLHSPLKDPRKSAEIWPSLLDAALPFPLESCLVAFGDSRSAADGGMTCLAAAIRMEDLRAAGAFWADLGLDPDVMVPEALVICGNAPGVHVWIGDERSVFVHWTEAGFSACGGAKDPSRESKTLARFLGALSETRPPVWTGPGGEGDADSLERGLAAFGLGKGAAGGIMNLRADALAHPGLARRARRLRKRQQALLLVLVLAAAGVPLMLRGRMEGRIEAARVRTADVYRRATGSVSPPGQERLLMERWIDAEWGEVRAAADRIFAPGVRGGMGEILSVLSRFGVTVRGWTQESDNVDLSFAADRETAEQILEAVEAYGWRGELLEATNGVWTLKGERTL